MYIITVCGVKFPTNVYILILLQSESMQAYDHLYVIFPEIHIKASFLETAVEHITRYE